MSLHAVVLAAGSSSRMGRPKALLRLEGTSFFARALALASVADQTLVVTGAVPEDQLRAAAPGAEARFVANPAPQRGQFSSIVIGARALPASASALLLTVDRPRVALATVLALRDRWHGEKEKIHTPQFEGETGHPIIVPATLVDALREADPASGTLREFVRSGRWERVKMVVGDAGVVENVDTPADYDALAR